MWSIIKSVYFSLPVQLLMLCLKKYQLLLLFWVVLFSTIHGGFMNSFGAAALFLSPEYLGNVNWLSAAITGAGIGAFVMSWNVTTFILYSRYFRFLATTARPFLKYCLNNFILPLFFTVDFLVQATRFDQAKELMTTGEVLGMLAGFGLGLLFVFGLSFLYFYEADRSISRRLTPLISNPRLFKSEFRSKELQNISRFVRVNWYLNRPLSVRKARDVSHYPREFIERIFSRHHIAAIFSMFIAFIFLIVVGFNLDTPGFQLPASASIFIFFSVLLCLSGAFSYFFQSWSLPLLILLFGLFNLLYRYEVVDPTNKAYGLNYTNREDRPAYDRDNLLSLCTPEKTEAAEKNMLSILNKWKAKQSGTKPLMIFINTSGGGSRSAAFTMNVLQQLDANMKGGLMDRTVLITGASGGMFGAAYFRELARLKKMKDPSINLQDPEYARAISADLLNPLFSSFVARDLASPAQRFHVGEYAYIKDRGYAFEQKLNSNTGGLLDRQLKDIAPDEKNARIPLLLLSSVVTRDSRTLLLSSQPMNFLMRPPVDSARMGMVDPDAVDFGSLFARQDPMSLRLLTGLRMNATFPYVLPNVWLPTRPVIDVMDAGFRDNFGEQLATRFVNVFRDWIKENTRGVLLIQIRDRKTGGWENPFETNNITELASKPMLLLQYNWYKMQEYNQADMLSVMEDVIGPDFYKTVFQYEPKKANEGAALNFHLTRQEKLDIANALQLPVNEAAFKKVSLLLKPAAKGGSSF